MGIGKIEDAAMRVRRALELARDEGGFYGMQPLQRFPHGCCGVASSLLAEYLNQKMDVDSIWVSASRGDWSHVWLAVNDGSVQPTCQGDTYADAPVDVKQVLSSYGAAVADIDNCRYREEDLRKLMIIDITADQFPDYQESVYVGPLDDFHRSFEYLGAWSHEELGADKLQQFYDTMLVYLA